MICKVQIISDCPVICAGLKVFIELDPELELVAVTNSGEEAIATAQTLLPDVLVTDIYALEQTNLNLINPLKAILPDLKFLVIGNVLERAVIVRIMRSGINGYLLHTTQPDEICKSLKAVCSDQIIMSPQISQILLEADNTSYVEKLTERELAVMELVAEGKANKEIAYQLKLSEKTIKTHVSIIFAKLNLQSRTQLALYAAQNGFLYKVPTK